MFQVDSDDEMGPEKFGELWSRRHDYDFLVGIRDGRVQTFARKAVSFVSRLCVRLFYGRGVWDVNTPYRLMRVSAFADFFRRIPLTTFAPNVILSGLAARHRLRCFETRVPQHDRTTGEVSIKKWKLLKAAVKSFGQTIAFSLDSKRGWCIFGCLCTVSTLLKFLFSMKGWNFDFESYGIVADIVNSKDNVYAETARYNYGPIWFHVLGFLKATLGDHFRYGIIAVLCAADIGIAALLWMRKQFAATLIFLLSFVSIHISGYHNQFDNLAILVAFAAMLFVNRAKESGTGCLHWIGVVLLGVSITIKHIFIFMPIWFLFDRMTWKRKLASFLIPLMLFLFSFIPYSMSTDMDKNREFARCIPELVQRVKKHTGVRRYCRETIKPLNYPAVGILRNVFLYRSQPTNDFSRCFLPQVVVEITPKILLFIALMTGLGWISRQKDWFERGLIYSLGIFAFSPAMAMQYYAIPCAAAAILWKPFGLAFHAVIGCFCIPFGGWIIMARPIRVFAMVLILGCLVTALRKEVIRYLRDAIRFAQKLDVK